MRSSGLLQLAAEGQGVAGRRSVSGVLSLNTSNMVRHWSGCSQYWPLTWEVINYNSMLLWLTIFFPHYVEITWLGSTSKYPTDWVHLLENEISNPMWNRCIVWISPRSSSTVGELGGTPFKLRLGYCTLRPIGLWTPASPILKTQMGVLSNGLHCQVLFYRLTFTCTYCKVENWYMSIISVYNWTVHVHEFKILRDLDLYQELSSNV